MYFGTNAAPGAEKERWRLRVQNRDSERDEKYGRIDRKFRTNFAPGNMRARYVMLTRVVIHFFIGGYVGAHLELSEKKSKIATRNDCKRHYM